MNLNWKNIAVVGAAGKMGKGISLVLLEEIARREAEELADSGTGKYCLYLIDRNEDQLYALRKHLRSKLVRYAEKNIHFLRKYFESNDKLVSNGEIIDYFVQGGLDIIRPETDIRKAAQSFVVFESIVESIPQKIELYKRLKDICSPETLFFSNTSSIPIAFLNEQTGLKSRIIGFHFYNPPDIQKLVEAVYPSDSEQKSKEITNNIGSALKKTVVVSEDVAGFIGNGHFIREIAFACEQVKLLTKSYPEHQAIAIVDLVVKEFLLRPMGIFQLIDFVGVDVCSNIAKIMTKFLGRDFSSDLIEKMLQRQKCGGQNLEGSQKDGFFQYLNGRAQTVYSLDTDVYQPYPVGLENLLGSFPEIHWKTLQKDPRKKEKIGRHFETLKKTASLGAELAMAFLNHSSTAAKDLLERGVARTKEDVDTVLKSGFYHLYSPFEIEELVNR